MASELFVDNITGKTGTSGGAPITLSGDTVTLGTGTTLGSGVTGFGLITGADQYRLTTDFTTNGYITGSNVERNDTVFEKIGTGVSYDSSNGVFTFPNTGIWWVVCGAFYDSTDGAEVYAGIRIEVSTTGVSGSYSTRAQAFESMYGTTANGSSFASCILDVSSITSSTAVAVKFYIETSSTDVRIRGDSNFNETHFTFLRLGDT